MKIETEQSAVQTATHDLIDQRFQLIGREEDFIVLMNEASEEGFLQASFEKGAVIDLEYRNEADKTLYRCSCEVSLEEARSLFHDYLDQKPNWHVAFPWEAVDLGLIGFNSMPMKLILFVIVVIAVIIAVWDFFSRWLA